MSTSRIEYDGDHLFHDVQEVVMEDVHEEQQHALIHEVDEETTDNEQLPTSHSYGIMHETPNKTIYWIPNVNPPFKPVLFSTFNNLDEVYDMYFVYARKGGFESKKGPQKEQDCQVSYKYYQCTREGVNPKEKKVINYDSLDKEKQVRNRPSRRIMCKAEIGVRFVSKTQKYELYLFEEKHNHSMVHPDDRHHLTSNRRLTYSQKTIIHQMSNRNLGPVVAYNILTQIHGGHGKVGATAVDVKNFKRDMIDYIGPYDATMLVKKLIQKSELTSFSFEHTTDEEGEVSGLFWADDDAKRNYSAFGDIISFDATYRTNKYMMVFVPFTGIDNHSKSVTFGAALLKRETIESYRWLLKSFKETFKREPVVVLTDQDPAMKVAIELEFTAARHRFCMWHITEKFTSKVGALICRSGFKKRISKIIWNDKIDTAYFDRKWASLIEEYGLQENNWLSDMFELRHKWIPSYFRDLPFSGLMRTSSRSESENHMFGQLTNTDLTLVEFYSHFETAMESQRFTQGKNDHDSRYTVPKLETELPFEKQAMESFTRKVFLSLQKEMIAIIKCYSTNVIDIGEAKKYTIVDTAVEIKNYDDEGSEIIGGHEIIELEFQVEYNASLEKFHCSCQQFERCGLLCRHVFYVMRIAKIKVYPKHYILKRWTMECVPPKSISSTTLNQLNGNKEDSREILRDIFFTVDTTVNHLMVDDEKLTTYRDALKQLLDNVKSEMSNQHVMGNKEFIGSLIGLPQPDKITSKVPTGIRNKGTGKHKRLKSSRELAIERSAKPLRECKTCFKMTNEHDSRNCKKLSELAKQKTQANTNVS